MKRLAMLLAALALHLGVGQANTHAETDRLTIKDSTGAVVINQNVNEFFLQLQVGSFPNTFKAGTVFFTETQGGGTLTTLDDPPVDVTARKASDALSINGSNLTGLFNVFFASDGIAAADAKMVPIFANINTTDEVNGKMDVSAFFGFAAGSIVLTSPGAVPEPSSWILLGLGIVGVLCYHRRRIAGSI
jgi:hypothetical protein